jgi:hypothetical protein
MIFHASIPADAPERVARVLGELLGGGTARSLLGVTGLWRAVAQTTNTVPQAKSIPATKS